MYDGPGFALAGQVLGVIVRDGAGDVPGVVDGYEFIGEAVNELFSPLPTLTR